MLGAIIGDVVGSVYEFNNTKDYNFTLLSDSSNYTDDSVMTVAVAEWLLHDPTHSYDGLEASMLVFSEKYPSPMGGYGGGFHTWLFHPDKLYTYDYSNGQPPYRSKTGRHPYGSWGNGSAMRVSPVGWFFDTLEETERVAEISAAITHNHPEGIKGAQATAAAIWMARNGKSKEEIRNYIETRYGYDLHKSYNYWYPFYGWESSCQGTVPQAIICFLDSTNFEDAIRKAVSLGGDSDTLACITGGIAEAFYCGVPEVIEQKIMEMLPDTFLKSLSAMQMKTAYGKVCPFHTDIASFKKVATQDSWDTLPMPETNVTVHLDLHLTDEQMAIILHGHVPKSMGDHWFMFCGDNKIRYYRSWSGHCIYEAAFEESFNGFRVTSLTINQDPDQFNIPVERATSLFCALLMERCGFDASKYWEQYLEEH